MILLHKSKATTGSTVVNPLPTRMDEAAAAEEEKEEEEEVDGREGLREVSGSSGSQMESGFYLAQLRYRDIPFSLVPAPLPDVRPQPCTHSLHNTPITPFEDACSEKIRFISGSKGDAMSSESASLDLRALAKLVASSNLAACGTRGVASASFESRLHVYDMEEDEEGGE